MTNRAYEVQTYTICDGWVNCWNVHNEDGTSSPQTFYTHEAAQAEIDEFLDDIREEIGLGNRQPDEGYSRSEFRIRRVSR